MVELLVVVAIMITLALLVITVASRMKAKAKSVATLGNLREIGVSAQAWMADNNNFYPPCWDNTNGRNLSYVQTLGAILHDHPNFRGADSKFIGPNARLKVTVGKFSHPATFSMNPAVCRNVTQIEGVVPKLVHSAQVERPSDVILMADGCQKPSNLGQSNVSAFKVTAAVSTTGPQAQFGDPIPVGPDTDTAAGDGWFRYADDKCHALMCDGSAQVFAKGSIQKRNIWIDRERE